ncbi:MAG: HAD family hydrolase [Bdellovibrionota bacterium]
MQQNDDQMSHSDEVLKQMVSKVKGNSLQGLKTLVVFDLDSTLFDVSPRLQKILDHYYEQPHHHEKFPEYTKFFKDIKAEKKDWGIKKAILRTGIAEVSEEFIESVREFWRKHFFSNDYLEYDHVAEGAVEFVTELHRDGADIAYLTGRDVERMGEGSARILKKWGFPLGERAELVLKPHRSMDDVEYKEGWFKNLNAKNYESVWFFENEPTIIHQVRATLPWVNIVFFDSTHSGKAEAPTNLPTVQHFDWKDKK